MNKIGEIGKNVATALVSHGSQLAVATEPLPGGFVSVSPVPGSSASSVAPMDELFFGALLSHFPRLSTSHFPRLSTLSGPRFLTLLRLGGSLWWTYQVFFLFLHAYKFLLTSSFGPSSTVCLSFPPSGDNLFSVRAIFIVHYPRSSAQTRFSDGSVLFRPH